MSTEVRSSLPVGTVRGSTFSSTNVLAHDGWLTWNEEMWGLRAHRVFVGQAANGPTLESVIYTTRSGRVRMPPRSPYLPIGFTPTPASRDSKRSSQWIELAGEFADQLRMRGLRGAIALPPGVIDARPFQWAGFLASVRYTYVMPLPFTDDHASSSVRKNVRKAERFGLAVAASAEWDLIHHCLASTEGAKGFSHRTPPVSLRRLACLLGDERLRAYLTRLPSGEPVSALLQLQSPGGTLIDWSAGTLREHLPTGAVQLTYRGAIRAAERGGATEFDFVGANIPAVAKAKSEWGAQLTPYLVLEQPSMRSLAQHAMHVVGQLRWPRSRANQLGPVP